MKRTLTGCLIGCLAVLASSVMDANASDPRMELSVSPSSLAPGERLTATVINARPGEWILVSCNAPDGRLVRVTGQANGAGRWISNYSTFGWASGNYSQCRAATSQDAGRNQSLPTSFTVKSVRLSIVSQVMPNRVVANVTDAAPGSDLYLSCLDSAGALQEDTGTTDANGNWGRDYNSDGWPSGSWTNCSAVVGGAHSAIIDFVVLQ